MICYRVDAAQHKAKDLLTVLQERGLQKTPTLFVDTEISEDLFLASRNIKYFDVLPASVSHDGATPPPASTRAALGYLFLGYRSLVLSDLTAIAAQTLNTYDLLKRTVLIITRDAAEELEQRLAKT